MNPLGWVLLGLVALCALMVAGVIVANLFGANRQPVDTWSPPPVDMQPPAFPKPTTYTEAKDWVENNKIYAQSIAGTANCTDLKPVEALKATEEELNAHLLNLTSCLLRVWQAPMEAAGFQMPRPPATVYSQPITTPCGKSPMRNAVYCTLDQRIYYARDLPTAGGPALQDRKFVMEMVLGHEFGHAIQARTGMFTASRAWEQRAATKAEANVWGRRLELQPDCLSGMWVRSVAESQGLTADDIDGLKKFTYALGDDILTGKPNFDADHGLGATRQRWFELGLSDDTRIGKCNTYTVPPDQVR